MMCMFSGSQLSPLPPPLYCRWLWKTHNGLELLYWLSRLRVGSGVVRIDPLCFLAGCRKRRLNQALAVLSLRPGFF